MEYATIVSQGSAMRASGPSSVLSPVPVRQEVRCAVRFPLELSAVIFDEDRSYAAKTRNISASGVLFELDHSVSVGENLRFSLRMPGQVLGIEHDVLVHCTGRVVRCYLSEDQHLAAATIDEYEFAAQ